MEIENFQRKFTKLIKGFEHLSCKERIVKLGLTTLLERRTRGDLIEMFKIINNFVSNGQSMFTTVFNITVFRDLLNVDQLRIGIGCQ
jgi:hypothetical protein